MPARRTELPFVRSAVASDDRDTIGLGVRELKYMAEPPSIPVRKRHLSACSTDLAVRDGMLHNDAARFRPSPKILENRIPSRDWPF